ncbi:hypothetical protein L1987_15897 [Smallanthus sonchifolius]|uniref:Uncharacterized protein n=1 Tax=Smallanthus sonchifolius TaxID=185202 RepID=A0ACB9J8Y6_9ASTR|nr:hypothetical protein L1987_15897 [Smallanthus sonchifolius]
MDEANCHPIFEEKQYIFLGTEKAKAEKFSKGKDVEEDTTLLENLIHKKVDMMEQCRWVWLVPTLPTDGQQQELVIDDNSYRWETTVSTEARY